MRAVTFVVLAAVGLLATPVLAAGSDALPTPESAAAQNLLQQLEAANKRAAVTEANLAATMAVMAQKDEYWKRYIAEPPNAKPPEVK